MKDYKNIPFINLSKDNLKLVRYLPDAEAGKIFKALYPFIYEGEEPENITEGLTKGLWDNVIDTIDRKAEAYLKKVETGTKNFQKINKERKAKREIVDQETGEVFESFDPQYSNDTGITTDGPDRKLY